MPRPLAVEPGPGAASELRQDPFTREWVLIAPERAHRPRRAPEPPTVPTWTEAVEPDCPFCPGNEDRTPEELWRLPGPDGNWDVRVVPNRYPFLSTGLGPVRHRPLTPFLAADASGAHEVVVETPRHDLDLPDLDDAAATRVFAAYRARWHALLALRPGLILPFRNHGEAAGTSLGHPHSQIVAVPVVPPRYRQRFDIARAYHDDHGTSLHADVLAAEIGDGARVIAVADHVVALAPFASAAAYEIRVVPRGDQASFQGISDAALAETARMVRRLLAALRDLLGDVPYNYAVVSAPDGEERTAFDSWHLDVLPRLTTAGGFELATGIAVNTVPPEQAAARLRRAMARQADQSQ